MSLFISILFFLMSFVALCGVIAEKDLNHRRHLLISLAICATVVLMNYILGGIL